MTAFYSVCFQITMGFYRLQINNLMYHLMHTMGKKKKSNKRGAFVPPPVTCGDSFKMDWQRERTKDRFIYHEQSELGV